MFNQKKLEILLLILFPVLSVILSLVIKANFLVSTLFFFGLPAIWLSSRTKMAIKKTVLFSFIFSIPLAIIVDYRAILDKSWYVPTTVFPFRLLDIIPIENLI
jgi:hypothetical protein